MKKQILLLLATTLVLFPVYLIAGDKAAYAPVSVPMEPKKLTDDVYYVEGLAGAATDH